MSSLELQVIFLTVTVTILYVEVLDGTSEKLSYLFFGDEMKFPVSLICKENIKNYIMTIC